MRSDYKRMAISIIARYDTRENVTFAVSRWASGSETGWGVQASFDGAEPKTREGEVAYPAESKEEAEAIVEAIRRSRLEAAPTPARTGTLPNVTIQTRTRIWVMECHWCGRLWQGVGRIEDYKEGRTCWICQRGVLRPRPVRQIPEAEQPTDASLPAQEPIP